MPPGFPPPFLPPGAPPLPFPPNMGPSPPGLAPPPQFVPASTNTPPVPIASTPIPTHSASTPTPSSAIPPLQLPDESLKQILPGFKKPTKLHYTEPNFSPVSPLVNVNNYFYFLMLWTRRRSGHETPNTTLRRVRPQFLARRRREGRKERGLKISCRWRVWSGCWRKGKGNPSLSHPSSPSPR